MIIGSEDDDRVFMKNVEDLGATFVVDEHCTGSRYIWDDVAPHEDKLFAIASRYVKRVPCPSKDWPEFTRVNHSVKLAKEFNAILVPLDEIFQQASIKRPANLWAEDGVHPTFPGHALIALTWLEKLTIKI